MSFIGSGLEGRKILATVKTFQASVGAACHSDVVSRPSHILTAIGVPHDIAINALRLSVGRNTTKKHINLAVEDLKVAVDCLKQR